MQPNYKSQPIDSILPFMQSMVSAIPAPALVIDINLRVTCLNSAMQHILPQEEIIGLNISKFIIGNGSYADNGKKPFSTETTGRLSFAVDMGMVDHYDVVWSKLAYIKGLPQQLIGILKKADDTQTNKIKINDTLNEPPIKEELMAVLHAISDGIYVGDLERITFANTAALEILGLKDLKQLNLNLSTLAEKLQLKDAVTNQPITLLQTPFARSLHGECVTMDVLINHQLTGEQRMIRCATAPLLRNGKIMGAIAINTDVTTERISKDKLRQSEERQAFILGFADAIRFISDPIAIQEVATRMLGEHLHTDRVFYAKMDEKFQQSRVETEFVRHQSISLIGNHRYLDLGIAVSTLSAGYPFIADDFSTVPELDPQRESYQAMEFNSLMATPLIKDGKMVAFMCITQCTPRHWTQSELQLLEEIAERTWAAVELAYAQAALEQRDTELRTFIAASSEMVYRVSADWKQLQQVSSESFEPDCGQAVKNWMQKYVIAEDHAHLNKAIQKAVKSKKMFDIEHRVFESDGEIGWRHCRAIPILNKSGEVKEWLATASNISQRKLAQKRLQKLTLELEKQVLKRTAELKESRDQLKLIFDTTLTQISILEAVRSGSGKIIDFKINFANKALEKETGRIDLVGKHYAREYPGIIKAGLFKLIEKTVQTGTPQQMEYHYVHEGFNKWYSCMFVKLGDGVVASNTDITPSKLAQEERFKNYVLLQHSEELAFLGNWDYDLSTKIFSWSDGMYRLFDLKKITEISPEIYLNYTTQSGRATAQRVVEHIRAGDSSFTETLELDIAGKIKILHLKATVVKNKDGTPERVLGVDMDVTASMEAEQTIRRMEAEQQQEIFRVTLESQEEERRRISESLHNGLAQSLYGIKMSIAHLTAEMANKNLIKFEQTKRYTEQLLIDAISESRRISHELMPSVLEDFGLEAAIADICKQLSKTINFDCAFSGLTSRPDRLMELAVFRTVQELALNVVKHANATEAKISVRFTDKGFFLEVSDNGVGTGDFKTSNGIGLTSIRSKVKLLNGHMIIEASPGLGTAITVEIPGDGRAAG